MSEHTFEVRVRSLRAYNVEHVRREVEQFVAALVEFHTLYKPIVACEVVEETKEQPTHERD